ncbi:MAG: hypothetical protein EOP00_33295, partial [Pedobacter sp.]
MLTSCVSHKNIAYFQDIQGVDKAKLENAAAFVEPKIQPDDILSVNIFTLNPNTGAVINQAAPTPVLGGSSPSGAGQVLNAFLVDKNG